MSRKGKNNNRKIGIVFLIVIGIYIIYEIVKAVSKAVIKILNNGIFIRVLLAIVVIVAIAGATLLIYQFIKNKTKTTFTSSYGSSKTRARNAYGYRKKQNNTITKR